MGINVGALTADEYRDLLIEAGFATARITPTHPITGGLYSAIVRPTPGPEQARPGLSRSDSVIGAGRAGGGGGGQQQGHEWSPSPVAGVPQARR